MLCNLLIFKALPVNLALFDSIEEDIIVLILLFLAVLFLALYLVSRFVVHRIRKSGKELEESYRQLKESHDSLAKEKEELLLSYEEIKQSEEKVRKLAYVDSLTQLPNRDSITEQITNVLKTIGPDEQAALLYLDIDNLKDINDTLGYTYGDELLIDITYRIKQLLNEDDIMARLSGDEFVIFSRNILNLTEYEEKIKKIITVFSFPFSLADKECFISISMGICKVLDEYKTAATIIKNANAAMYKAKEIGKNQYCYFNEELQNSLMDQFQKQTDVRIGFENDEFYTVFQPVLDLKKKKILGFEMLLRWQQEEELLLPHDFLEATIESGVIVPMGLKFFKEACLNLKTWQKKGYEDLCLMVNLSSRQLLDYDVVADIDLILKETQVVKESIVFDISEEVFDSNDELITERIKQLRLLGARICLDNFGKANASLTRVVEAKYDFIKVDQSLTQEMMCNETSMLLIKNLTKLFHDIPSRVIYEGVEEAEQLEKIEQFESSLVQGFLFGAPMQDKDVLSYLDTWMN